MNKPRWHWRNCRSIGFSLHFWVWPWAFGIMRDDDVYGGRVDIHAGPFGATMHYSIGNRCSYGLDRFTALSEHDAWERASKYKGSDL